MSYVERMAETSPSQVPFDQAAWTECIKACFDCAQACTACADACLGEQDVTMLAGCIRLNGDCADVCLATGRMLSRQTAVPAPLMRSLLAVCAEACRLCGEECERHGRHGMEHCRVCAEACARCAESCERLRDVIRV